MPPVFRFAPSPNGYLHLGHAYSALLNFDLAGHTGGRFLLRIEDIDPTRCKPEFEAAIHEDLGWLGISLGDPGATAVASISPITAGRSSAWSGSAWSIRVSRAVPRLPAGWHSRKPRGRRGRAIPTGRRSIPARQRRLRPASVRTPVESGAPSRCGSTWRRPVRAPAISAGSSRARDPAARPARSTARPQAWGDVVLARKETPTSYHLSVVIDDALQGVTEVVRGQDLFWSTSVHRLLQALLGLPQPVYRHHRLILDSAGRKLSKSTAATGLRELRAAGATPADIRRRRRLAVI